jgi:hypothetical protein
MFLRRTERLNRKINTRKRKAKKQKDIELAMGGEEQQKGLGGVRNIFKRRVGHKYNTFIYLVKEICDTVTDTRKP